MIQNMSSFLLQNTIHLTLLGMHQCSHVVPQTIVTHNSCEGLGMLHYTLITFHCIQVDIERLSFSPAVKLHNF